MFVAGLACRPPFSKPFLNLSSLISRSLISFLWKYSRCQWLSESLLHWPGVTVLGPQGTWTATICGLMVCGCPRSSAGLGSPSRCPTLLAPIKFTVNMSSFYHELLTSHLMTIIFIKHSLNKDLWPWKIPDNTFLNDVFFQHKSWGKLDPQLPWSLTDRRGPSNPLNQKGII